VTNFTSSCQAQHVSFVVILWPKHVRTSRVLEFRQGAPHGLRAPDRDRISHPVKPSDRLFLLIPSECGALVRTETSAKEGLLWQMMNVPSQVERGGFLLPRGGFVELVR
jgi:hypothetical protein